MFLEIFSVVLLVSGFSCLQDFPWTWPLHYHVRSSNSGVYITCPLEAKNISWKTTNPIPSHQKTQHTQWVDHRSAGRYTCTDANSKTRDSTIYVLIQGSSLTITCVTDSYGSKEIHCSTKHEFADVVLVRAKVYREIHEKNSRWMESQHEESPIAFTVPIPSVSCPLEEHTNAFRVLVEVMTEKEYWKVDTPISMTDVVTPGAPENLTVRGDQIFWSYPSSWTRPYSFFPLLFQVRFRRRDSTKGNQTMEERTYSRKDLCHFKVRCRDLYSPLSPWSEWSQDINPNDEKFLHC